jgi:hypothetical protein
MSIVVKNLLKAVSEALEAAELMSTGRPALPNLGNSVVSSTAFLRPQRTRMGCWTVSPRSVKSTKPNQATPT